MHVDSDIAQNKAKSMYVYSGVREAHVIFICAQVVTKTPKCTHMYSLHYMYICMAYRSCTNP